MMKATTDEMPRIPDILITPIAEVYNARIGKMLASHETTLNKLQETLDELEVFEVDRGAISAMAAKELGGDGYDEALLMQVLDDFHRRNEIAVLEGALTGLSSEVLEKEKRQIAKSLFAEHAGEHLATLAALGQFALETDKPGLAELAAHKVKQLEDRRSWVSSLALRFSLRDELPPLSGKVAANWSAAVRLPETARSKIEELRRALVGEFLERNEGVQASMFRGLSWQSKAEAIRPEELAQIIEQLARERRHLPSEIRGRLLVPLRSWLQL